MTSGFSTACQSKNSGPFNRYSHHNEMRTGNSSVRCGVRKLRIYICNLFNDVNNSDYTMSNYWILSNSEKVVEPNSRGLILMCYCGIALEVQRNTKNLLIVDNPGEIWSEHLSNRSRVAVWNNFLGNRVILNRSRLSGMFITSGLLRCWFWNCLIPKKLFELNLWWNFSLEFTRTFFGIQKFSIRTVSKIYLFRNLNSCHIVDKHPT
jgi:hypothetical protein